MEQEEEVIPEDLETQDGEESTETGSEEGEENPPTPEELKALREKAARADELEEKNKQLFERAKKKEGAVEKKAVDSLTPKDALILAKANVHEDDLDEVLEWAAFKKIPVADALKDATLKTILSTRAEERVTAEATNTEGGGRGAAKPSGDDLLRKAESTGEVPDTTEGMNALFLARQARKTNKKR